MDRTIVKSIHTKLGYAKVLMNGDKRYCPLNNVDEIVYEYKRTAAEAIVRHHEICLEIKDALLKEVTNGKTN